jgi:hypothetical protein
MLLVVIAGIVPLTSQLRDLVAPNKAVFTINIATAGFHTASPTSGRFPYAYAFVYLVTSIILGFLSCIKAI